MRHNFKTTILVSSLLATTLLTSCTPKTKIITNTVKEEVITYREPPAEQGVVNYIWEEPMVDVVDVPAGLDPEGHYYRRAHQEVVEVRQGRWRYGGEAK